MFVWLVGVLSFLRWQLEVMTGGDVCKNIFQRNFGLHEMCRRGEQAAAWSGDSEIINGFRIDFLWCSEGEERLRAQRAPEGEAVAVFGVNFRKIHAFWLDGIENVDSRVDQVVDKRFHETAGMVGDENVWIDGSGGLYHIGETWLEILAIHVQRHHDRMLHADIVSKKNQIDAGLRVQACLCDGDFGDFVQMVDGHGIFIKHAHHHVFHAAHVPCAFPDGALHVSDSEKTLVMNDLRLFGCIGQGIWIEDGIRIVLHICQRCKMAHGMVHASHVHGFGRFFMADAENVEIDFMGESHIFEIGILPVREWLEQGADIDVSYWKLEFANVVAVMEFPFEFVNHDGAKREIHSGVCDSIAAEQPVQIFSW